MKFFIILCSFARFVVGFQGGNDTTSLRSPRWYPLGLVQYENGVCVSTNGLVGTCYSRRVCKDLNGTPSGKCAGPIGSCCVIQRNCGDISSFNNTYFVNPNFPSTYGGGGSCTLTIQRCNPDICQLRIDFLSFSLAQPDGTGHCLNDVLLIQGGGGGTISLCGENSGQHVYVDFFDNQDINIIINTNTAVTMERKWTIRISQIACNCPTRAPTGCLMYYTTKDGTVKSFNFGDTVSAGLNGNPNMDRPGTRELAGLNYGVCVEMIPGYCSIRWSQTPGNPLSFTVTGDTITLGMNLPSGGMVGFENCMTDYVVISNPIDVATNTPIQDRFCGNQFATIETFTKPFVLRVVTNNEEASDVGNRGFSLNYAQQRCAYQHIN